MTGSGTLAQLVMIASTGGGVWRRSDSASVLFGATTSSHRLGQNAALDLDVGPRVVGQVGL